MQRSSYLFSLLVILYILVYIFIYKQIDTPYSIFNTSPILDNKKVFDGYTLISPYNRLLNQNPQWQGKIYLLDLLGKPVHTWKTQHQALYSVLKTNGNLLVVMELPEYKETAPPGGRTGIIQELDWNSNVVWEYKNEMMHHDLVILPNGNVAVTLWEKTPADIAERISGGAEGTQLDGTVWSDLLVEINKNKEIVWEWHSYQHLDPKTDILGSLMPKFAWTYTNGISYVPHSPIDGEEAYLISMRSLNEVMFVRKRDGNIIWRSPKGMLNTQHDPTYLQNSNILVFDNGLTRAPDPYPVYGSRVVEIDPKVNRIVWQFDGGSGAVDKARFFAPIVGGSQRLPNGNTLITDGVRGHLFEVTKEGKVVWDLVNPYTTQMTGPFPNNFLFKARRYEENEIQWPEKIASSLNKTEYTLYNILKNIYPR